MKNVFIFTIGFIIGTMYMIALASKRIPIWQARDQTLGCMTGVLDLADEVAKLHGMDKAKEQEEIIDKELDNCQTRFFEKINDK